MGNAPHRNVVTTRESGFGPFGHPVPGGCPTRTIRLGADPASTGEQPHAFGRLITLTGDLAAGERALLIAMAQMPRPQSAGGRGRDPHARGRVR